MSWLKTPDISYEHRLQTSNVNKNAAASSIQVSISNGNDITLTFK